MSEHHSISAATNQLDMSSSAASVALKRIETQIDCVTVCA
ncbi:hypothetical protein [Paraglaciecola chathamensis]